ncbi:uncharacterized protein EI97DRAFT_445349 [Westerdykella ornata]|uniref:DUF803-domain-containing protein n=1 Tax=Westerdykella ornata TaxID=318751 RepID=A0A6A6J8K1_WESOR|nr:uncharacterized protein EI97DRAFT_445349 [Westerdykella ornata]KAF2272890.1 hypothetical protein EI97DRAFT_445349 [Westerdykella ornata]
MLMFIVANLVGSTIQITTLPLPVLSTLQASGLVFNSICASIILSEPFTRYSLAGTVLVAAGAGLIGTFGAIPEPSHNLDQLLRLLRRYQFIIWMIGTLVGVLLLLVANWILKRLHPRGTPRLRLIRGMVFGSISGILSAHSLLIAKSAVELLVRTIIDRHNEFKRWQSWMILIGLVVFALTQLYYMHRGLKLCSTSVLYPLVFCVYNIIAIIDGLIYFHQSSRLSNLQAGLIALGTIILLAGVVSLSWRLEEHEEEPTTPLAHKRFGVPPPQNVLTPGMALVHGTMDEEFESPIDIEDLEPGMHGALTDRRQRQAADERTPLLARAPTGPAVVVSRRKRKHPVIDTGGHLSPRATLSPGRPPRQRRMTIAQGTDEIWDALNDREHLSPGIPSPGTDRKPRSGTLPPRRIGSSSSWLQQMRRRSWWESTGGGKQRNTGLPHAERNGQSNDNGHQTPEPDDTQSDTDVESGPMLGRTRNSRNRGSTDYVENQGSSGDWFKLRWWRKRWKDREGDEDEHDHDATI